jgi:hypothetical protein
LEFWQEKQRALSNSKKILLLFLALLTIGAIWFYRHWRQEELIPSKEDKTSIKLGNTNQLLYLKARIWGVAGNHEEIVLSLSGSNLPNKTNDYIFYTSEVFYKVEGDSSIIVYAPESSISEPVKKLPNVKTKGLKTADEIMDYHNNYQKYGLRRMSTL